MVHTFLVNRRRHYGTGTAPERHYDRGGPSSDTPNRIVLELLPFRTGAFHLRQTADAMALQTPVQRRPGQLRDRRLKRIETVVEGQQGLLAESDDDGLLLDGQNSRPGLGGPCAAIAHRTTLPPLGHRLGIDAMAASQCRS